MKIYQHFHFGEMLLLAFSMVVTGLAGPAAADEKSWVGESVLQTRASREIKFAESVGGKELAYAFSGKWPFKVRDEKSGWLRLHDGTHEGWVRKSDFVLVRDAIDYFSQRIEANPNDKFAYSMRGAAWREKKEYDKALSDFNEYVRRAPNDAAAYNNRGLVYADRKEYDEAIADYTEALRINPRNVVTYVNRSVALRNKKDYDRAIEDCETALRVNPRFVSAINARGIARSLKKEYAAAIKDYEQALRMDPKLIQANSKFAWLLATCPDDSYRDGRRAVQLATKACELSKNASVDLDALAAAYAETGDFAGAVNYEKRALQSASFVKQHGTGARKRLKLYEQQQPYRE